MEMGGAGPQVKGSVTVHWAMPTVSALQTASIASTWGKLPGMYVKQQGWISVFGQGRLVGQVRVGSTCKERQRKLNMMVYETRKS